MEAPSTSQTCALGMVDEGDGNKDDSSLSGSGCSDRPDVHADQLFLDSEERYEVYSVKCAERPHLTLCDERSEKDLETDEAGYEEKKVDLGDRTSSTDRIDNSQNDTASDSFEKIDELPLIDGCDLPGWRREGFVAVSDSLRGVLGVGGASTMFRRESVLPTTAGISAAETALWTKMRDMMSTGAPPKDRDAACVDSEEYSQPVVVDGRTTTKFARDFERRNIPAKILGCASTWKAMPNYGNRNMSGVKQQKDLLFDEGGEGGWTFSNLLERFGNIMWRFSDTHGEMLSLFTYSKYITNLEGLTDDSPLAVYDAEFGDDNSPTCPLRREYEVPKCFSMDLFGLASSSREGDDMRPPYRWILIGPERSGTGMHIDPLWTNAWVTVLQGLKRWLLFPPCTPPEKIGMIEGQPQIPSVVWFRDYYDIVTSADWPKEWRPVEVLQRPGETVFVPNGWGHLVLNLKLTVAVTHNFASEYGPFERMWEQVALDEQEFASRWYDGMKKDRPDLCRRVQDYHRKAIAAGKVWAASLPLTSCVGQDAP